MNMRERMGSIEPEHAEFSNTYPDQGCGSMAAGWIVIIGILGGLLWALESVSP